MSVFLKLLIIMITFAIVILTESNITHINQLQISTILYVYKDNKLM